MQFDSTITLVANALRDMNLSSLLDDKVLLPAERIRFVEAIREYDNPARYTELENAGIEIQRKRRQALERMDAAQKRIADLKPHIDILNEIAHQRKKRLINQPEWFETRELILQKAVKGNLNPDNVNTFLQRVGNTTLNTMLSSLGDTVGLMNLRLNRYRIDLLASLIGATIAQVIGESGSSSAFPLDGQAEEAEQAASKVIKECWDHEQRLAFALADEEPALARQAALDLSGVFELYKEMLLAHAFALHNVQQSERNQSHMDALIRLGEAIANILRALTLGSFVASFSLGGKDNPIFTRWSKYAKKLNILQPEHSIGSLPTELLHNQRPGELISVRGVVRKQANFQWELASGRIKTMQFLTVADECGGEISVAVPYLNLFAVGGELDMPIRVTGIWSDDVIRAHMRRSNPDELKELEAFPRAGIDIDRINLKEEAKTSWWYWATSEIRKIYDTLPNSLNVSWGWEPKGAVNLLRYGLWCKRG
ncbi:MAG: hypothetical protein ACE3JP_13530 [Ectobacillus sp.]